MHRPAKTRLPPSATGLLEKPPSDVSSAERDWLTKLEASYRQGSRAHRIHAVLRATPSVPSDRCLELAWNLLRLDRTDLSSESDDDDRSEWRRIPSTA